MRHSLPWLLCLTPLLLTPAHSAPTGPGDFVLLEREALLITPPKLVAEGMVRQAEWSPDGKYVLALTGELPYASKLDLQKPPTLKGRLVLWNAAAGEGKEIWTGPALGQVEGQFAWFSRGDTAAVLLDLSRPIPTPERPKGAPPAFRRERWLCRLDARRGVMRPVTRVDDQAQVSAAPVAPAVLVWSFQSPARTVMRLDGSLLPLQVPDGQLFGAQWLEDGRRAVIGAVVQAQDGKVTGQKQIVADVATGMVTQAEGSSKSYEKPKSASHLRVVGLEVPLGVGKDAPRLKTLWLETTVKTEQPRVMLASDADWCTLSPAGDAVLYADDRGAWVVRPLSLPKEMFFQARAAAERSRLLSHGKQLGLALMMYAQDNEERFPGENEAVNQLLSPYMKNEALFEGFVYTFGGGPLASIEKPAEQVLGHVLGPGGRALIYADGHVRWEPDAK